MNGSISIDAVRLHRLLRRVRAVVAVQVVDVIRPISGEVHRRRALRRLPPAVIKRTRQLRSAVDSNHH